MTGICGWLDTSSNCSNQEQHAITHNMGDALGKPGAVQADNLQRDGNSASGAHHAGQGETSRHEGLLISYCGRPRWSDEQLKDLASEAPVIRLVNLCPGLPQSRP